MDQKSFMFFLRNSNDCNKMRSGTAIFFVNRGLRLIEWWRADVRMHCSRSLGNCGDAMLSPSFELTKSIPLAASRGAIKPFIWSLTTCWVRTRTSEASSLVFSDGLLALLLQSYHFHSSPNLHSYYTHCCSLLLVMGQKQAFKFQDMNLLMTLEVDVIN